MYISSMSQTVIPTLQISNIHYMTNNESKIILVIVLIAWLVAF